jgi:hypothetical protein
MKNENIVIIKKIYKLIKNIINLQINKSNLRN